MSIPINDGDLVVRPCKSQYTAMLKATPVFLLVPALYFALREGMVGLYITVGVLAVAGVLLVAFFKGAHVVVTDTQIERSGITPRRRVRPRSDVEHVVTATMPLSVVDSRIADNLFLLDRNGRRILRMQSTYWSPEDMARVVEKIGMQPRSFPDVMSIKEFTEVYPKALPMIERRPWLTAMLAVAAIVVVVTAGVLVATTV